MFGADVAKARQVGEIEERVVVCGLIGGHKASCLTRVNRLDVNRRATLVAAPDIDIIGAAGCDSNRGYGTNYQKFVLRVFRCDICARPPGVQTLLPWTGGVAVRAPGLYESERSGLVLCGMV